jgi:8-oxo-dGTP pyrophosphatase MutT (NUDIX family)
MSRIPPDATRVFNGEIFDVYQWQQPLFDGTTATFEALRRGSTAFVLALQGEDVIYARQEQPRKGVFRSLLGGRVEEGETPLEGAKRELLEEAGMASDSWTLVRTYHAPGKIEHDVYLFVARECRVVAPQNLDAGERITLERTPLDTFIRDVLGADDFLFRELRAEVFSAYNPAAAARFKAAVLA